MSLAVDLGHDHDLSERLRSELTTFLHTRADTDLAAELRTELATVVLVGGKRLRPRLAWWGWRAAGGPAGGPEAVVTTRALISLELLQACAVLHDDVMDRSTHRRGRRATHRGFAAQHDNARWSGDSSRYGESTAILLGDLALVWADDALVTAGLPPDALARAWRPWQAMRTEMMAGQHLDLLAVARREESMVQALRVATLKTASYTVERPLHLGAAIAGAAPEVVDALRAFGRDVGVAFQLRDDLLNVFGDSVATGKPAGDDLRQGKRTPLMAAALARAQSAGRVEDLRLLRDCLDDPPAPEHLLARVPALLHELGAVADIEQQIATLTARGLAALDTAPIDPVARDQLTQLALTMARRQR